MATELIGDALAGIEDGLFDLDGRSAPFLHCCRKDDGDRAPVVFAELQCLLPIELPFAKLFQDALHEGTGNDPPATKGDESLEHEHQQDEGAQADGVHQRAALIHHVQQILGRDFALRRRLFCQRALCQGRRSQRQRAAQRHKDRPVAQRDSPHNQLPCFHRRSSC